MNNAIKLTIIVVLALAVVAVVIAKRTGRPADSPLPANVSPTTQPVAGTHTLPLPRLVDLGAGKCIPCKKMAPILEELKKEFAGKLQVDFIDVWINPDAGQQYGISLIPTQIFYDASGKELYRHEGFMPKEDILFRFQEHGIQLTASAK
jgi:thioredoxin 1